MFSIKRKLAAGLGVMLLIIAIVGVLTLFQIRGLGMAIDTILKENYRSVLACQEMREAIEGLNNGLLHSLIGDDEKADELLKNSNNKFLAAIELEFETITITGELEEAKNIEQLFSKYSEYEPLVVNNLLTYDERRKAYIEIIIPIFNDIKSATDRVLLLNQEHMDSANSEALLLAESANARMMLIVIIAFILVLIVSVFSHRWIIKPINKLIESANEIRLGNLDLVLESNSHDEIGKLSSAFNEMTSALRQVRKTDKINLVKTKKATENVFNALPLPVALLDSSCKVELSTANAKKYFGLNNEISIDELGFSYLREDISRSLDVNREIKAKLPDDYVQKFIDGEEHFFDILIVPIPEEESFEASGVVLIFNDITQLRQQQELKRGVLSTVSHQLKTPLTSLRMSVYLLLDEKIGVLNDKQLELLLTARDDSQRLINIIDDLLNLNKIESGKSMIELKAISPSTLFDGAIMAHLSLAKDSGVAIANNISQELPYVMADEKRIYHVIGNIISNAIRFTQAGGEITLNAEILEGEILFNIKDTGCGMSDDEQKHVFDLFYRAPGQDNKTGIGLGLSIAKEIIESHGGKISVESKLGEGTALSFTLRKAD